ncbi:phosphatase inhibitor-domain-containing protein [Aspergillus karnatakaensis]|uniref:PPP1R11/YPI1 family protein n=1 Tax=Aspergillus karnatakaensis TaxID=1810916 RepID=UPI003CCCAB19
MSHSRQITSQRSTPSSRISSVSRVQEDTSNSQVTGTLRLRAEEDTQAIRDESSTRRIRWSEDVIDNEGMGKKSSKVCCIYHKTRPVGESSSESESDSGSSESEGDCGPRNENNRKTCRRTRHNHDAAQRSPERGRTSSGHTHDGGKHKQRKPSPNAYEKMPKNTKG